MPNIELNFSHRSCDSLPACESGEIFGPILDWRKDRHLDKPINFNNFRAETFVQIAT